MISKTGKALKKGSNFENTGISRNKKLSGTEKKFVITKRYFDIGEHWRNLKYLSVNSVTTAKNEKYVIRDAKPY